MKPNTDEIKKLTRDIRATDKQWAKTEMRKKRRALREEMRPSIDHAPNGERERQVQRDRDISLKKTMGRDGVLHVEVGQVKVGGGLKISQEDWDAIFCEKRETGKEDTSH